MKKTFEEAHEVFAKFHEMYGKKILNDPPRTVEDRKYFTDIIDTMIKDTGWTFAEYSDEKEKRNPDLKEYIDLAKTISERREALLEAVKALKEKQ